MFGGLAVQSIMLIAIGLVVASGFVFTEVVVTVGDTTVRQITSYSFEVKRSLTPGFVFTAWDQEAVPALSSLTLQFPAQYSSSLSAATLTSFSLTTNLATYSITPSLTTASNLIIFSNFTTVPTFISSISVKISNIANPAPGIKTTSFVAVVGNDQSEEGTGVSSVQLTPGSLVGCTARFQKGLVNRKDNLTISFTSLSVLSPEAIVKVTFPTSYLRDPLSQSLGLTASMVCTTQLTTYGISCNTTVSNSTVNIYHSLPTSGASSVQLTINDILSPPTTQAIDQISIRTYSSAMIQYDSCTCGYTNLQSAALVPSIQTNQTVTVGSQVVATVAIPLLDVLFTSDYIVLTLTALYVPIYQVISLSGMFNTQNITFTINSNNSNTINITSNASVAAGNTLKVILNYVFAPKDTSQELSVKVGIYTQGYPKGEGTVVLAAASNSVGGLWLQVADTTAGVNTTYTLYFNTASPIDSAGMIQLQLPQEIALPSVITTSTLNTQPVTAVILPSNTIRLTALPIALAGINNTITLGALGNPSSTAPLGTSLGITIYSTTVASTVIAEGHHLPSELSYTASGTLGMSVAADSLVVNNKNTSWEFAISTMLGIPQGGRLEIEIYQMEGWVVDTNFTCRVATGSTSFDQLCTMTYSGTHRVVVVLSVAVAKGLNVTLVQAMTNPSSTRPSVYFSLSSFSAGGQGIEVSSSPTYLVINTPQAMLSFTVARSSLVNSALSTYTLSLTQQSAFITAAPATNQILATFPSELSLSQAFCSSCTITGNEVLFQLSSSLVQNSTTVVVVLSNVANAPSFKPTQSSVSVVTMLDNVYNYSSAMEPNNKMALINTIPAALVLTAPLSNYSNPFLGEQDTLNIVIQLASSQAYYYQISIDPGFNTINITCQVDTRFVCLVGNQTVKIVPNGSIVSTGTLAVQIAGLGNPTATDDRIYQSTAEGYSSDDYLVNRYTGTALQWRSQCAFPCRSCVSAAARSSCLGCYPSTLTVMTHLSSNACLAACPATAVPDASLICQPCSSPCLECSMATGNCTACDLGSVYSYLYNSTCIRGELCPTTTYPSNYQCLPCSSPCLECNATNCLSCVSFAFFYLEQCYYDCPAGTVPAGTVCQNCSDVCGTCAIVPSNCTTCALGTVYFNGSCLLQCQPPLLILGPQCVELCSSPCLTCSLYAQRCLSCAAPLYLSSSTCLSSCPSLSYPNTTSSTCSPCSSLALNCNNCRSNGQCTIFGGSTICSQEQMYQCLSCNAGFGLYFNSSVAVWQCLEVVPDGYVNLNGVAELCLSPCLTCSGIQLNCTLCISLPYFEGQCLPTCPSQYYPMSVNATVNETLVITTSICAKCVEPCLTCTSGSSCLSCTNNTYFYNYSCVGQCAQYYYSNATTWQCQPCQSPCLTCTTYYNCTACIVGRYLLGQECSAACPQGYFPNATALECQGCSPPCLSCHLQDSQCLSCTLVTYYYSYNYSCLSECPVGFYPNGQFCLNCTAPCLECTPSQCQKCMVDYLSRSYYLYQGTCVTQCPPSTFAQNDPVNPACRDCHESCLTCSSSSSNCLSCNTVLGYKVLQNDTSVCVLNCPEELPVLVSQGDQLICKDCSDLLCSVCLPTDKCILCLNYSLALYSGRCYSVCPEKLVYSFNATTNTSLCVQPEPVVPLPPVAVVEGREIVLPFNFPCSIAAAGLIFLAVLAKSYQLCLKQNQKAMLTAMVSAALALPEVAAMALSAYSYFLLRYTVFLAGVHQWDPFLWSYCLCLLATGATGVYVLVAVTRMFWGDRIYLKWTRAASCFQKMFQYGVNIFTPLNFKIIHSLFCGVRSLPLLDSSSKLAVLNFPSAISTLIALVFTLTSGLNISFHPELTLIYIDSIIVAVLSTLFGLLALRRDKSFYVLELADDELKYPVNKRINGEEEHLKIAGISPDKDCNSLYSSNRILRRERREHLGDISSDYIQDQLRSESGRSHPSSCELKSQSVRLENFSLQCTVMDGSESRAAEGSSESNSVRCLPPERSSYSGILWQSSHRHQEQESIQGEVHPTNLGMLEQGQNSSVSASNDEIEDKAKFILPLEFRRYAFQEQAEHNYSQKSVSQSLKNDSRDEDEEARQSQKARALNKREKAGSYGGESLSINVDQSNLKEEDQFQGFQLKVQEVENSSKQLKRGDVSHSPRVSVNSDDPEKSNSKPHSLDSYKQPSDAEDRHSRLRQINLDRVSEMPGERVKKQQKVEESCDLTPNASSVRSDPSIQAPMVIVKKKEASKQVWMHSGGFMADLPPESEAVGEISLGSSSIPQNKDISNRSEQWVLKMKAKANNSQCSFSQIQHIQKRDENKALPSYKADASVSSYQSKPPLKEKYLSSFASKAAPQQKSSSKQTMKKDSKISSSIPADTEHNEEFKREVQQIKEEEEQEELDWMNVSKSENWSNGPASSGSGISEEHEEDRESEEESIPKQYYQQSPQQIVEGEEMSLQKGKFYHSTISKDAVQQSNLGGGSLSSYNSAHFSRNSSSSNVFDRPLESSLKRSQRSLGGNMQPQVKLTYQKYLEGREIVDQEAQSIEIQEINDHEGEDEEYLSEKKVAKVEEGNQFRIKTTRRKRKKGGKTQRQLVLYVDDQKFKTLKNEAKMIKRQIRINERLQRHIEEEREEIYRPHRPAVEEGEERRGSEGEERRGSLTKIESVYLTPPKTVHLTPPKQKPDPSIKK